MPLEELTAEKMKARREKELKEIDRKRSSAAGLTVSEHVNTANDEVDQRARTQSHTYLWLAFLRIT